MFKVDSLLRVFSVEATLACVGGCSGTIDGDDEDAGGNRRADAGRDACSFDGGGL